MAKMSWIDDAGQDPSYLARLHTFTVSFDRHAFAPVGRSSRRLTAVHGNPSTYFGPVAR
jgi:hypothetical protein